MKRQDAIEISNVAGFMLKEVEKHILGSLCLSTPYLTRELLAIIPERYRNLYLEVDTLRQLIADRLISLIDE